MTYNTTVEIRSITERDRQSFNRVVSHPLQSYEWGEFRKKTGLRVIRKGFFEKNTLISAFSLTLHNIPKTQWFIGYLPKGDLPTAELIIELKKIGRDERCIFIQLEPNVEKTSTAKEDITQLGLIPAAHPLFTKYTFALDLTQSEEDLLRGMHPKARYNIRVAQRHGVEVIEDNSPEAFESYWQLMEETTKRQHFYAHTKQYHKLQWEVFHAQKSFQSHSEKKASSSKQNFYDELSSHLFLARYRGKVLTAWTLFVFGDTLYYPYGASSSEFRETMHSSLMMWEAIQFGKKLGLKRFDLWGALGEQPNRSDPWFGFHDFKRKFGPAHVEFVGSYDLVLSPFLYPAYTFVDKLRWLYLKLKF
jgi:lipid II:glycine glycyltransferase (peptidoglycan interpeptide bridge formation enzyme)